MTTRKRDLDLSCLTPKNTLYKIGELVRVCLINTRASLIVQRNSKQIAVLPTSLLASIPAELLVVELVALGWSEDEIESFLQELES